MLAFSSNHTGAFRRCKTSWVVVAAVFMGLFLTAVSQAQQDVKQATSQLTKPTMQNQVSARLVSMMMERLHLSKLPLDDTIAGRAFDHYVKALDPLKDYFLQEDIEEFEAFENEIDDKIQTGNFDIAFMIFRRFIERVDQRTALALEMIDHPHDFTIEETLATDPDMLTFAKSDAEVRDKWRKRIKYSLLVLRSAEEASEKKKREKAAEDGSSAKDEASPSKVTKKPDPPEEILRKRYQAFNRRMHQMDTEDVLERYISAVTTSFDPHTSYMSKKTYENFIIQMGLELEGIGATLQGTDDGYTTIKNVVKGGAAYTQGGLKVEDKIHAVGQGEEDGTKLDPDLVAKHGTDFVDVSFMKLDDVVGMIRGKAGTTVRLSVMSEDGDLHTVNIVREKIKLEDQAARGEVFEQGKNSDGSPRKVGVIELPSFYADFSGGDGRSTTRDVRKIIDDFNSQGVDGLVLDLRMNGGGSLPEAIDLTGLFIDLGPVVQVKDLHGGIDELSDKAAGMAWKKPLVVLTSKFSASASEILAGAIQDYGRGLVVGDTTTHGKGTVQSLRNLSEILSGVPNVPSKHGALKITTAQFYRPNGDSTQKRGVLSDLVLPSITDNMEGIAEADLDFPVEFDRIRRAAFSPVTMINDTVISALQVKSAARMAASEDFVKLNKKITKYVEQKKLKMISLNAEKYKARREELNADEEDKSLIEDQLDNDDGIERDFYLDEVLAIASDYMDLLK